MTVDSNRRVEIYRQEDKTVHRIQEEHVPNVNLLPSCVKRKENFFGRNAAGTNYFDGDIDDIIISSRVVKGPDLKPFRDIKKPEEDTIVGHWDFNEGSGKVAQAEYSSLHGLLGGGKTAHFPVWIPTIECNFCSFQKLTTTRSI